MAAFVARPTEAHGAPVRWVAEALVTLVLLLENRGVSKSETEDALARHQTKRHITVAPR